MRSLSIVSSPLQLINAIEAIQHFKTQDNSLVIVYYSNDSFQSVQQLKTLISFYPWSMVYEVGGEKKGSKFLEYLKLLFNFKKQSYDYCFVGHFGHFQMNSLANLHVQHIYCIDDGVATLFYHTTLLNPSVVVKKKWSQKVKDIRFKFFGFKVHMNKDRINYFTMFNLKPLHKELIIKNDFKYIKKYQKLQQSIDPHLVYFLGQPLVDVQFMNLEVYIEYIKAIKKYFREKDMKIMYIPHRKETLLDELKVLEDDFFYIQPLSEGIELFLIKAYVIPAIVVSFVSTALFTLSKLFDSIMVQAIQIDTQCLLRNAENWDHFYEMAREDGIDLIEITSL